MSHYGFQIANKQIEIYCGETSLDPELDLRTVKHMIWKKFTAIELQYRRRKSEDQKNGTAETMVPLNSTCSKNS